MEKNEVKYLYFKEYWVGDSRDGNLVNGEGYHFYRMESSGKIVEAYEYYELEDGNEVVSHLPEMTNVDWINDLGFEDMEILDTITKSEFESIKELGQKA